MRKPIWACTECGMYSSRRYSVKRHIKNIHGGSANLVSYTDYLLGRKWGYYWPTLIPPSYEKKQEDMLDHSRIFKEELLREMVRKQFRSSS
jgi:hypothetical protein